MKRTHLILICLLATLIFFHGCKSINVGGTGQIGSVTGGGSVNIPVFRADDQSSSNKEQ